RLDAPCQVTCSTYAPTCVVEKFPSQRWGAVDCNVTVSWKRSGVIILAWRAGASPALPGGQGQAVPLLYSTVRWPLPPATVVLTLSELSGAGNVQVTRLAHQRGASRHCSQFAVQRPRASLVQATTRPSPYCQTASTGSSLWLI